MIRRVIDRLEVVNIKQAVLLPINERTACSFSSVSSLLHR